MQPGQVLLHYRLVDKIGEGGMGVVWRALDTTLDREVAIKFLPEGFTADSDRLVRLEREAKLLATLNHPSIAAVYGLHEQHGMRFIAMEFVPGETLADRLTRGALSLDDSLNLASQIADAVQTAHEHGVIHRDLKPANIRITPDGTAKVLDFGLAKSIEGPASGDASFSPTVTSGGTAAGVILGTAAYMSPEQARGKPLDRRVDVWSFGCVLYEMLTGRRCFAGETASDTLAGILLREPDWDLLPRETPPGIHRLLRRCLAKDPRQRWHSVGDARLELDEAGTESAESPVASPERASGVGVWLARFSPWAVAVASAGIAVWALLGVRAGPETPTIKSVRLLTDQPNVMGVPSLSPDGSTVAFEAGVGPNTDIFVQRVGGSRAVNLTAECTLEDSMPAFSPDGESIAYRSECGGGGLLVMGATGESPRRVTDFGFSPAWSPDGRKLAITTEWTYDPMWQTGKSELWVVDTANGETRRILEGNASSPSWSPDGRWIAYFAYTEGSNRDVWVVPASESDTTAKPVRVTFGPADAWSPQWSPDGRLLYFLSSRVGVPNLWRVGFDSATGTPGDHPEPVMLPLAPRYVSLDRGGNRLALEIEGWQSSLQRLDIDPVGGDTRSQPTAILDSAAIFRQVTMSPDGRWIAGGLLLDSDLFVVRADGTGFRRLTQDPDDDQTPAWWPDGSGLVFSSDRGGGFALWSINLDGSGLRQLTPEGTDCAAWPIWSPDGRFLVSGQSKTCLWKRHASGELELAEALPAPADDRVFFASWWSPDSRNVIGIAMHEGGGYSEEAVGFDIETREFRRLPNLDGLYSCRPLRDSRRAVCRAGVEGEIVVADLQSGARTVLLGKAEVRDLATWSIAPGREWLCLLRRQQQREMYVVELE